MEIKLLKNYFNGIVSASSLKNTLTSEVENYKNALSKKGSSVPIFVSPIQKDENVLLLNREDFIKLCTDYLNDYLEEFDIYYIIDIISLSENIEIENEEVKDLFYGIGDPEINGEISAERIQQLLNRI